MAGAGGMNRCVGHTTRCTGEPAGMYRWIGRREPAALCRACYAVLDSLGLHLIACEERPVERRPAWLERLRAKDMTERAA